MTISSAATIQELLAPNLRTSFVDGNGVLTTHGWQVLTNFMNYMQGTSRFIPCNATGTNVIALAMLQTSPLITKYNSFDTFQFTAAATTTGLVTANVVTPQGALATLNVYKTNGSAQATTGDIVIDQQYHLTYVDTFGGGAGGFVLR